MTARARQLRRSEAPSEHVLWEALRGAKMAGTKWRRQQKIERFVVDFFCAEERLVVEIDGGIHADRREADVERERILERNGLRVVRFSADLVEKDLPCVLARLRAHLSPSPPAGEGARG